MENLSTSKSLKTQTQDAVSEVSSYADDIVARVKGWFKTSETYVRENPQEAAIIGVSIGVAAWVLLSTRPGKRLFEVAADRYIPEVGHWLSKNFDASKITKH